MSGFIDVNLYSGAGLGLVTSIAECFIYRVSISVFRVVISVLSVSNSSKIVVTSSDLVRKFELKFERS